MSEPIRISSHEASPKISSGSALLVCAYDDDDKFKKNHLEGAISFSEFKSKLPLLAKDQEVIFYCAWPGEASAAGQADKCINDGYTNVSVLKGGVAAWKEAGFSVVQ